MDKVTQDIKILKRREYSLKHYYKNYEREKEKARLRALTDEERERRRLYMQSYRQNPENREIMLNRLKESYHKNKDKRFEYRKEYYAKNRLKLLEQKKRYTKDNAEKLKEKNRQYFKTEKGQAFARNQRFIRKYNQEFTDITTEYLMLLKVETEYCGICGIALNQVNGKEFNGSHLDHIIPLNIGGKHVKDNVRFVCRDCNLSRPKDGRDLIKNVA